jgi:predicted acyltransferase
MIRPFSFCDHAALMFRGGYVVRMPSDVSNSREDAPTTIAAPIAVPTRAPGGRIASIDVFRGLTMAAMVLVNNPGDWAHVYAPLLHAKWNGCTPTDLIFPFFLFIVGVSMWISLGRKLEAGQLQPSTRLLAKIIKRGVVLVIVGLFLNAFPFFEVSTLRLPGVLQRIGVCFIIAALVVLYVPRAWRVWLGLAALVGYALMIRLAPGGAAPEANIARTLDLLVLTKAHVWRGAPTDPEGLLSTIPATVTVLVGFAAARLVFGGGGGGSEAGLPAVTRRLPSSAPARAMMVGMPLMALGLAASYVDPLNKPLWSSSYVLFTAGAAFVTLAACVHAADVKRLTRATRWLEVFGTNALTLFVGSALVGRIMTAIKVPATWASQAVGDVGADSGAAITLKAFVHQNAFASWLDPKPASLAFAVANLAIWWVILWWMNRRGWIWKV